LYDRLMQLPIRPDFPYYEPDELDRVRSASPPGPRRLKFRLSERGLRDRIRGAFLGRCAGCLLGKPVEGWDHERIVAALKNDRAFPLNGYFRESTLRRAGLSQLPRHCLRGAIRYMPRDDDIDYTILGIHYLREYGPGFSLEDVAREWLGRLPYHRVYTAERAAYRNLVQAVPLEQCGIVHNPYREWIGAQIRADGLGYCAAGLPARAAEFAYRDGFLSHRKNGIYGEMFFAAMIAAALVSDDLSQPIQAGLAQIPRQSRLAEAIRDVQNWAQQHRDWQQTCQAIRHKYGHYHPVHTINNAAVVVMALLHGRLDFGKTIAIAVMAGWDTDCNAATAGSVAGAILGAENLPARWIRPLRDHLRSFVVGYDHCSITQIADNAYEVSRRLRRRRS
ncbi:MAG: ADP-ribosylglycohydrolase family protein, partial [Phycisphaerae bacterium]